ncbi:MAG: GNAT family N-acetyltransferase [Pseudomonadota bacterium]
MSTTFTIPSVETERLILRAPELADLPGMSAFFASDRSGMVGGPRTEAECWRSISVRAGHWAIRGFGLWHLTQKSSGAFVGWAGIIDEPGWDEPELGYALMAEAEGQGLAFEAATAARDYAARHLGLNGVLSFIAHANARSIKLAERLGATYEREGDVLGKTCQVWRHPTIEVD